VTTTVQIRGEVAGKAVTLKTGRAGELGHGTRTDETMMVIWRGDATTTLNGQRDIEMTSTTEDKNVGDLMLGIEVEITKGQEVDPTGGTQRGIK